MARLPANISRAVLIGLVVGVIALAALVLALVFWDDVVPDARKEAQADARDEAGEIAAAKSAIVAEASEAQDITYGPIRVNWLGEDAAVCGEVAIDEPDDSIEGTERFVFVDGELTLPSRDGDDAVNQKWKDVCEG